MIESQNQTSGKYFLWLTDTELIHFPKIRAPNNINEVFLVFMCQVKALLTEIKQIILKRPILLRAYNNICGLNLVNKQAQ